jgi:predicted transcriptional regulator
MTYPAGYVQIGFKVPREFVERLEKLQERRYCDRATLMREAIAKFLDAEELRIAQQDAEMKAHFSEAKATEAA